MRCRALLTAGLLLGLLAPAAGAALPAPSLSVISGFNPPNGFARVDFATATASTPHGAAIDGDRIYSVGETGTGTAGDVAVVARHRDGTLDSSFAGDGTLTLAVSAANVEDNAVAIVVLPDHHLRVLVVTGQNSTRAGAILGLNPDGTADTAFGAGDGTADGIVTFGGSFSPNAPADLAVAPDGRLAVTGTTNVATDDDTYIALFAADGSPLTDFGTGGVRVYDRSGNHTPDFGASVAFLPNGNPVVLTQVGTAAAVAVLHAFTNIGADDTSFSDDGDLVLDAIGDAPTIPTALLTDGARLWMTGGTMSAADGNAFLARVQADGTGLQSRQFDMRGQLVSQAQAVNSTGTALAIVEPYYGAPRTLVVGGSLTFGSSVDWAAAAFNNFDGDLSAAGFGDIAAQIPGSGGITGLAAADDGTVAITGPYQETVNSTTYVRTAQARLAIDAEKTCDLTLDVPSPLELAMHPFFGGNGITVTIANNGGRACSGSLAAAAPFSLAEGTSTGDLSVGTLGPGESRTLTDVVLHYGGPLVAGALSTFTLTSAPDSDMSGNVARLHVRFNYCDVSLQPATQPTYVPSEGTRRFLVTARGNGTIACLGSVRVGGAGVRGSRGPYSVQPGRSVVIGVRAGLRPGSNPVPGTTIPIGFAASAATDSNPADDLAIVQPTILGVARSVPAEPRHHGRVIFGIARPGRGSAKRAAIRVTRVEVAVRRVGVGGCRWLESAAKSHFRVSPTARDGGCGTPVWLRADGTLRWRLDTAGLRPGRYVLLTRAWIGAGFPEASFTKHDANRRTFVIR